MATIQINALARASLPLALTDIFHLKQGVVDKQCTLQELLGPHASRTDNPHNVTKTQLQLGNVTNDAQFAISKLFSEISGDDTKKETARNNLGIMSRAEVAGAVNAHASRTDNPHHTDKAQVGLGNVPDWSASNDFKENADKLASSRALSALYRAIQNQNPVGSCLITYNSANPSSYMLCGGTWVLASVGHALVGAADGQAGQQFGSDARVLSVANMPAHNHVVTLSGGGHTHGASASIAASGHAHTFSGGTSSHDEPPVTTSWFDYGSRQTSDAGWHSHGAIWWFNGVKRADGGGPNDMAYGAHTQEQAGAGNHSHSVSIGGHNHTVDIGPHSHTFGGTTQADTHSHGASVSVAAAEHSHSGTVSTTGAGAAFDVVQASERIYVWRRTA